MKEKAIALLGKWGRPPDMPAKIALGLAALCLALVLFDRGRTLFDKNELSTKRFLFGTSFAAAILSLAYVSIYLEGGPRIIDATTYFLQGRALSHGDLTWTPVEPSASFRGRFLVYREGAEQMGGIFPPGYPLLLSFGFMIGAPLIIGPLLAGALVIATHRLARILATQAGFTPETTCIVARGAALLSIVCAALRYHTADTMSHGAAALGIILALTFALEERHVLAGLALGYVVATRPVSALPIALVLVWLVRKKIGRIALGAIPGVLLLLVAQDSVTGSAFTSTQRMYYALSDGPPGCFQWGFGKGVGCIHEHGDFVKARLPNGYGIGEALLTTLRRLRHHLADGFNFEPLIFVVLLALRRRVRGVIATASVIGFQILAYAPFYFDGDYPGGGARFFADVLPLEHVLAVIALAAIAQNARRAFYGFFALVLIGFGVHGAYDHLKLRDRDGGRPMFESDLLTKANVTKGLVFVDTDHAFALGYDAHASTKSGIVVARLLNDDRDRLLFEALDKPQSYLYKFEAPKDGSRAQPVVVPWAPPDLADPMRFEAEAEWPALSQTNGFAIPGWVHSCASAQKALIVTPTNGEIPARATITIPVREKGKYTVVVRIVRNATLPFGPPYPDRTQSESSAQIGASIFTWTEEGPPCVDLPVQTIELAPPHALVTIEAKHGPAAVDHITVHRVP